MQKHSALLLVVLLGACSAEDPGAIGPRRERPAPSAGGSSPSAPVDPLPPTGSIDAGVQDAPAESAADSSEAGVRCDEPGAVNAQGRCYFMLAQATTWDGAKTACTAAGAHLVSIGSAAEQTTVEAIGAGQVRWIGLRQKDGAAIADANAFEWVDGTPRNYTNWLAGEPNSDPCTRMNEQGLWTDRPCADAVTNVFLPLCERP
jgi:hypothetical protein